MTDGYGDFVIKLLKYGNTNTFFIKNSSEGLLFDTDWAGTLPLFYKEIKARDIAFDDIKYVMATHYHPDHMGLISELMTKGIQLILLDVQRDHVHYSDEIFRRDSRLHYTPICEEHAVIMTCEETRNFLKEIGINGECIHTPGHSDDSISLILDEGIALVGDLDPIDFVEAYEENTALKKSWERVLKFRPHTVYYGHANEKRFTS